MCCWLWTLCHTTQHGAVLIIFPLNLQTITITWMLSSGGQRGLEQRPRERSVNRWRRKHKKWTVIRWKWHGIRHITNYAVILSLTDWPIFCIKWQYVRICSPNSLYRVTVKFSNTSNHYMLGLQVCMGPTCYFIVLLCSSWNVPILCLQRQLSRGHVNKISTTLLWTQYRYSKKSFRGIQLFYRHFVNLPIFPGFPRFPRKWPSSL